MGNPSSAPVTVPVMILFWAKVTLMPKNRHSAKVRSFLPISFNFLRFLAIYG